MELTEYHYVYYSYEEYGNGYIGSRTCKCLPEEDIKYFGSYTDDNFKPTQKIIIKSDYATREEAYADEIILQEYYKVVENPHFANKAYQNSTKFYVPKEQATKYARKGGLKTKENGVGMFSLTPEQKSELGKRNGLKTKENGTGIFSMTPEEKLENCRKGGLRHKENGTGIFSLTAEQKSERSRKSGLKAKELGVGMFSLTPEQKSELGRKNASQRWECLETGYVSNAGALSHYQNARGIDTSKRKKIS
jgi:general stress protein YciG